MKAAKPRKCRCGATYERYSTLQTCCTDCLVKRGRKFAERAERTKLKERREKLKTRSDWIRETQAIVNKWIRARDEGLGCISCGTHNGKMNAGHFLSTGARPDLRFHPLNINTQCERCNSYLSGNQAAYRIALVAKIGLTEVERLEGPATLKQYTVETLRELKAHYQLLCRNLPEKDHG